MIALPFMHSIDICCQPKSTRHSLLSLTPQAPSNPPTRNSVSETNGNTIQSSFITDEQKKCRLTLPWKWPLKVCNVSLITNGVHSLPLQCKPELWVQRPRMRNIKRWRWATPSTDRGKTILFLKSSTLYWILYCLKKSHFLNMKS